MTAAARAERPAPPASGARRKDSGGAALLQTARDKTLGDGADTSSTTRARPSPSSGKCLNPEEGAAEGRPRPFFVCRWRPHPAADVVDVRVPIANEGQGIWEHEPRVVPQVPGSVERVMEERAARVRAEMAGARKPVGRRLDHHEIAAELKCEAAAVTAVLTALRNHGHVRRVGKRQRARPVKGVATEFGVWELTEAGAVRAAKEAKGERNDWGNRTMRRS